MPRKSTTTQPPGAGPFIVEVEGYEGADGEIIVRNFRAEAESLGVPHLIYCIAKADADGVVRFDDWGYATADEAQRALDGRLRRQRG